MKNFNLSYSPCGRKAILVQWPGEISGEILNDIISFREAVGRELKDEIQESVPAYNSLLIIFRQAITDSRHMSSLLEKIYISRPPVKARTRHLVRIPVCYEGRFSPDLEELAAVRGMAAEEVVRLHSLPFYTVYFIGFLPGFMYLGGLNKALHQPRKETPRVRVQKGAVGIAGSQTGIYPLESPGGWNIIGNSPISFLDPLSDPPFFAVAGDKVKFFPVSASEHEAILESSVRGEYILKKEVWNDQDS